MMTNSPFNADANRPVEVAIREEEVTVTLADGRRISNPLAWYPWLEQAKSAELSNVRLEPLGVLWPDLEFGLLVEDMLRGVHPNLEDGA